MDKQTGRFTLVDGGASSGSGIATIFNRPITTGGKVELYAPTGVINAGEAGIRAAGDLVLTANVAGADFIVSVGSSSVPAAPAAPSFAIAAPSTGNNDKTAATEAGAPDTRKVRERSSLLTVEVLASDEATTQPAATRNADAACEGASCKDDKRKR